MAVGLFNRVGVKVASAPGTGSVVLGAAIAANASIFQPKWQTFSAAGVPNGTQVRYLIYDGDEWEYGPGTYSGGALLRPNSAMDGSVAGQASSRNALLGLSSNAQVFITAVAEDFASSISDGSKGDIIVSGSGTTWTIGPNTVTNAKLAQVATSIIKGRVSPSTGNVEDLTGTQATTLLDTFTTTLKGLVPPPLAVAGKVLSDNGTWVTMSAGVSDGDKGDVVVSGSGSIWTIDTDVVDNTKLNNMVQATIKGRAVAAGTGDPQDLTGGQVLAVIEGVTPLLTEAEALAGYQPLDSDLTSWAGVTRAAGFDAFAATPSSANLRTLLTDETGTGLAYFQGGALGTPSSATLTNATGLPTILTANEVTDTTCNILFTTAAGAASPGTELGPKTNASLTYNSATGALAASSMTSGGNTVLTTASGAPIGSSYVVIALDATLTSERNLAVGSSLSLTDGGANAAVTLAVNSIAARSVFANATNASAVPSALQSTVAGQIINSTATALAWTATPTLGASGTLGTLSFGNATSGTITLQPTTGALGSTVLTMPATTGTLLTTASSGTSVPAAPPSTSVQFNNGGVLGGSANLVWDGNTLTATTGTTVALAAIGASTNSTTVNIRNTSIGGHDYYFFSSGQLNHPGTFGFYDGTVNDTWLQIDGNESGGAGHHRDAYIGWGDSSPFFSGIVDTRLYRDAANIVAQRKGAAAQTLRIYNTYTSSTIFERGIFSWENLYGANYLTIGTQKGSGGGTQRAVIFQGGYDGNAVFYFILGDPAIGGQIELGHVRNDKQWFSEGWNLNSDTAAFFNGGNQGVWLSKTARVLWDEGSLWWSGPAWIAAQTITTGTVGFFRTDSSSNTAAATGPVGLQIYNTLDNPTSPSIYERGVIGWKTTSNVFVIGTEKGPGGGTWRGVTFVSNGFFTFTGNSIGGTSSGTGFAISLGYNALNNKQLWMGDPDYLGNALGTFVRFISSNGITQVGGVSGDGSSNQPLGLDPAGVGTQVGGNLVFTRIFSASDIALGSPSAGLLEVNNANIGTYRDLKLRDTLSTRNVVIGTAAITTSATDNFLYLTTCPGIPSGTPTSFTGRDPIVYDSANNKMYCYNGGAWVVVGSGAGATTPGGANTQVQYNSGGTFGATSDFTWTSSGLTNKKHEAVGANATINSRIFAPGSPSGSATIGGQTVLLANEQFSGDLSGSTSTRFVGQATSIGIKHTGAGGAWIEGIAANVAINSDNTGPISNCTGVSCYMAKLGAGNQSSGAISGFTGAVEDYGSGTIGDMFGGYCYAADFGGTSTITNLIGAAFEAYAQGGDTITNLIALRAQLFKSTSTVTNAYGLNIKNCASMGASKSYNIYSEGTTFITPSSTVGGNLFVNHCAIGNYADVNNAISAPGDPGGGISAAFPYNAALNIDDYVSTTTLNGASINAMTGIKVTGGTSNFYTIDVEPTINSDSTGNFGDYYGLYFNPANRGSGTITNYVGGYFLVNQRAGAATNAKALWAQIIKPGGTITNAYGLFVDDCSGLGSSISENIRSVGINSVNTFEGSCRGSFLNDRIQDGDMVVIADFSLTVAEDYEIVAGKSLELQSNAILRIA